MWRQVLLLVIIGLGLGSAKASEPVGSSEMGWNADALVRGLDLMDHITKESYAAVFNRRDKLKITLFQKMKENLSALPSGALHSSTPASDRCGQVVLEATATSGRWLLYRQGCSPQEQKEKVELRRTAGKLEIDLFLDSWAPAMRFGSRAKGQITRCQMQFAEDVITSIGCRMVGAVTASGEEIFLDHLKYDQAASNVVDAKGHLYRLGGRSEELRLHAPALSSKIYVHLVEHLPPPRPEPPAEPELRPKSEKEILADMKALAEGWEDWQVDQVVNGEGPPQGQAMAEEHFDQEYQEFQRQYLESGPDGLEDQVQQYDAIEYEAHEGDHEQFSEEADLETYHEQQQHEFSREGSESQGYPPAAAGG